MTQCSIKKEIIPQVSLLSGKLRDGALVFFSKMKSFSGLFSQSVPRIRDVSYACPVHLSVGGGPKERGDEHRDYNSITGDQAGLKTLAC